MPSEPVCSSSLGPFAHHAFNLLNIFGMIDTPALVIGLDHFNSGAEVKRAELL